MDPITHGLLGTAVSQCLSMKKFSRQNWLIGALAAMAPDLDIFIRSSQDPLLFIIYHRNFTHSLAFIPVGGLIVGAFCLLLLPIFRQYWRLTLITAVAAYGTHGLLDACTSYGTMLFWPFSQERLSWDLIAIVDLVFMGILLVGVIIANYRKQVFPAFLAIVLSLGYLAGICVWQHHKAMNIQQDLAKSRHQNLEKGRVLPQIMQWWDWHSLYINQNHVFLDNIKTSLWAKPISFAVTVVPLLEKQNLPQYIQKNPLLLRGFTVFQWFCDGYVSAIFTKSLTMIDLRYLLYRTPYPVALWGLSFPTSSEKAQIIWESYLIFPKK